MLFSSKYIKTAEMFAITFIGRHIGVVDKMAIHAEDLKFEGVVAGYMEYGDLIGVKLTSNKLNGHNSQGIKLIHGYENLFVPGKMYWVNFLSVKNNKIEITIFNSPQNEIEQLIKILEL